MSENKEWRTARTFVVSTETKTSVPPVTANPDPVYGHWCVLSSSTYPPHHTVHDQLELAASAGEAGTVLFTIAQVRRSRFRVVNNRRLKPELRHASNLITHRLEHARRMLVGVGDRRGAWSSLQRSC